MNENAEENIPKIIICNKIDLEHNISQSKIKSFMKENNLQIFQSSAKTNTNLVEPFDFIIKEVLKIKKNKNQGISLNNDSSGGAVGCNC